MGGVGARGGGVYVKVGWTEECRSSFEQFDPRALSTLKKDTAEMLDGTPSVIALEPFEYFDPRALSTSTKDMAEIVDDTLGTVALEPVTKDK